LLTDLQDGIWRREVAAGVTVAAEEAVVEEEAAEAVTIATEEVVAEVIDTAEK